jgi:hypothetical protein
MSDMITDFIERLLSREFIVFVIATVLLVKGFLTADLWLYCGLGFMGLRTVQKTKQWDNLIKKKE